MKIRSDLGECHLYQAKIYHQKAADAIEVQLAANGATRLASPFFCLKTL